MTIMTELIAAADATTNNDPESAYSVKDPYGTNEGLFTPQATWTAQGKPALILRQPPTAYLRTPSCRLDFLPSGGSAVTYTAAVKRFNRLTKNWYSPKDNASFNLTGYISVPLENLDQDPWVIILSSISAGTIRIMYDDEMMRKLL